ncbi:hypothetical protein VNO77_41932 [Canavalia gladiata]|uniref:Uncharacterized protein n=1 Tax=Canavalia gladiata TaxID=3824 RepID=A0AAN9PQK4_CANGL
MGCYSSTTFHLHGMLRITCMGSLRDHSASSLSPLARAPKQYCESNGENQFPFQLGSTNETRLLTNLGFGHAKAILFIASYSKP